MTDDIDELDVSARVVTGSEQLRGAHQGSVWVQTEGRLGLIGSLEGSLHLRPRSEATIVGSHLGSLWLAADARLTVQGRQAGSLHVAADAVVDVAPGGTIAGSLHVEGLIRNGGTRAGSVSGPGVVEDLPGSAVRQPVAQPDGRMAYKFY